MLFTSIFTSPCPICPVFAELKALLQASRPFLGVLGKAKAGKLVSNLLDLSLTIDEDAQLKVDLCKESIEWSREQKRVFLRQSLEARLVRLYNDIGRHVDANALGECMSGGELLDAHQQML